MKTACALVKKAATAPKAVAQQLAHGLAGHAPLLAGAKATDGFSRF